MGLPIGNLTSQIFANIYLNELDRFICSQVKPLAYLRYGDDFLVFARNQAELIEWKQAIMTYLTDNLFLSVNAKNDFVLPVRLGIKFLGSWLYPTGRRLQFRNRQRVINSLNSSNQSSYRGLVMQNENAKHLRIFDWQTLINLAEND